MVKKINEFKELQKKKGKKGFSMIELIIVLAIMAILVALIGTQLIPYLEKSREKRDITTLDTCLTAVQSALADQEITIPKSTTGNQKISALLALDSTKQTAAEESFEAYAGLKLTDDDAFKSDVANDTAIGDVEIIITAGVIEGAVIVDSTGAQTDVIAKSK